MRDAARCFVPPKMPILATLVVEVKHFKKSSKCFATEWEMCLPHLKSGVRIDDEINFANPTCSSVPSELLHLLPCHVLVRGIQKDMDTCVVCSVVGQDLCESSVHPESA